MKPSMLAVGLLMAVFAAHARPADVQRETLRTHELAQADVATLRGLALGFVSSKTDTPESDLTVFPQELALSPSKSIVGFIGEDFSDHSSRVDRCYVAVFDRSSNLLSVVDRNFHSDLSEDSTPCRSAKTYAVHRQSDGSAWIAFLASYANPQTGSSDDDEVIEVYRLDAASDVLCYDEATTGEVNASGTLPDVSALIKILSARKPGTSSQCSKPI